VAKFSDSNWSILNEYFSILSGSRSGTHNSYLLSPKHTIVTEGGLFVDLYEHSDEYGYIGHNFTSDSVNDNIFKFKYQSVISTNSLTSGITTITNGSEMYFRKNSYFYEWLLNHYSEYRDYLNTNKMFLYFGKIWAISNEENYYSIEFKGLKDYMLELLPPINRTTAMEDWLKGYFDGTHHQIYNLTKNIWSMKDSKEIDIRFLQYIANDYGIEIKEGLTTELALREWVDNLIYFLKRKGDYSTLYIVYKFLLSNTTNTLNVFERWHDWRLSDYNDAPLASDWEDHHILEYYSIQPSGAAGDEYYSRYNPDGYPAYADSQGSLSINQNVDLFLEYKFDETGGLTATDSSSAGNNGTLTNFATSASNDMWVSGKFGNGVEFGISDDEHIDIGDSLVSTLSDSFTVSYYVKHNKFNHAMVHFMSSGIGGVLIGITPGNKFVIYYDDGINTTYWESEDDVLNGVETKFNKYVIVFKNNDIITVYKNNVLLENNGVDTGDMTDITMSNFTNTTNATIGNGFCGIMDEFRIYNTTLSELYLKALILSPHYRVELDLTSEPLGTDYIINESIANELVRYWNYTKPVSRFVTYNELVAPYAEIDGTDSKEISTYSTDETAYLTTKFTGAQYLSSEQSSAGFGDNTHNYNSVLSSDSWIIEIDSDTWNVNHNLGSKGTITQAYDNNNNLLLPSSVEVLNDDTLEFSFNSSVKGHALIADGNYTEAIEDTVGLGYGYSATSSGATALDFHYKFDETSGTTCDDDTGNSNGTLYNFPGDSSQWVTGKYNNGLHFRGFSEDDYVNTNTTMQTLFRSSFSISMWIKAEKMGTRAQVISGISNYSGSAQSTFWLEMSTDRRISVRIYDNYGNGVTNIRTPALTLEWEAGGNQTEYHLIVVAANYNNTLEIYYDGVKQILDGSSNDLTLLDMSTFSGVKSMAIGANIAYDGNDYNHYEGSIDDVKFYSGVLNQEDASSIYVGGPPNQTITHNLYSASAAEGVLTQLWSDSEKEMQYEIERNPNSDDLTVTLSASGSNRYIIVRKSDYTYTQSTPESTWNINHNLNTNALISQVFSQNKEILPLNTQHEYNDSTITFSEAVTGTADFVWINTEFNTYPTPDDPSGLSLSVSASYWKVGIGTTPTFNSIDANDIETIAASGSILSYENSTNGDIIILEFDVSQKIDINITEIGIFNDEDRLMFYTKCSPLYKPVDVILKLFYRITKFE